MKKLSYLFISVLLLGCIEKNNCKNAICTEMFAMATVKINVPTNIPISEISTQTISLSKINTIHTQTGASSSQNHLFTIVDDSDLNELGFNSNQEVELKIFRNGTFLKSASFVITTDCCHVTKTEGPDEINL